MSRPIVRLALPAVVVLLAAGCRGTESSRVLETQTVESYGTSYSGPRAALSVGKFNNASPYMRGIFSDGQDRLGNQARTILKTHLSQTNRFDLLDRENLEAMNQEAGFSGQELQIAGANLLVTGQVTEFGRKSVGDKQLFGVLGRGKTQTAYSKVSLNVVDARTSRIVHSVQGAGEYALSDREVLGFGSDAGYDSTLNGKVLNLAVTDAVNKLVRSIEMGEWDPSESMR
ncbi:Putative lipoprotein [Planctomycetes bacterium Poly30]|uniref:Lipoprotein n=1 Tax=Saltatorellus ferox TaxID=2528018 RepID=A0A518EKW6_9BACT|nr:Putative lipoprotein [Planctomycetes bacterium Poly30]